MAVHGQEFIPFAEKDDFKVKTADELNEYKPDNDIMMSLTMYSQMQRRANNCQNHTTQYQSNRLR